MKLYLLELCLLSIMLLISSGLRAQYHDFDSLLSNDQAFKEVMDEAYDQWDMFSAAEIMPVSLSADFKLLIKQKFKDQYQKAVLRYQINDTVTATRNIKIKARGNARKKACFYPPLKVNFAKKEVFWKQLKEYDKIKLVVECRNSKWASQVLLAEYYAYKLYNLITDYSFRVQLLEISYTDTSEKLAPDKGYAFFIENGDLLAARNKAVKVSLKNIEDRATDHKNLADLYIFQYLIGNTDWSIKGDHNIEFIKNNDPFNTKILTIPYDFDYAGIVEANYALPNDKYGLESVRDRMYLGTCLDEVYLRQTIDRFKALKTEIYSMYESSLLDKKTRQKTLAYLDQFYQVIESEPTLEQVFLTNCRD